MYSDTGKSVEDYRNIIKQLKVKCKRFEEKNTELMERLNEVKQGKIDKGAIERTLELNNQAVKMQSNYRGNDLY